MKAIILAIVLFATVANAEDQQGYVLRKDYLGREFYWEHEDYQSDNKQHVLTGNLLFYSPDQTYEKPAGGLLFSVPDFKWMEQNPKNYGDKGIVIVPAEIGGVHLGTFYYYEYKRTCDKNTLNIISGDGCWELRHTLDIKDYEN